MCWARCAASWASWYPCPCAWLRLPSPTRNWSVSTRRRPTGSNEKHVALGRAGRRPCPALVGHAAGSPALRVPLADRTPLPFLRADPRRVRARQGPLGRGPALARFEPAGGGYARRSALESAAPGAPVDAVSRRIRSTVSCTHLTLPTNRAVS